MVPKKRCRVAQRNMHMHVLEISLLLAIDFPRGASNPSLSASKHMHMQCFLLELVAPSTSKSFHRT